MPTAQWLRARSHRSHLDPRGPTTPRSTRTNPKLNKIPSKNSKNRPGSQDSAIFSIKKQNFLGYLQQPRIWDRNFWEMGQLFFSQTCASCARCFSRANKVDFRFQNRSQSQVRLVFTLIQWLAMRWQICTQLRV